jgi:hypothetical protein
MATRHVRRGICYKTFTCDQPMSVIRHVWFVTSIATLCLTFVPKVSYSIWTTNLRQSVAHLATNQTCPLPKGHTFWDPVYSSIYT